MRKNYVLKETTFWTCKVDAEARRSLQFPQEGHAAKCRWAENLGPARFK